jgi:hypothetical protein
MLNLWAILLLGVLGTIDRALLLKGVIDNAYIYTEMVVHLSFKTL